MTQISMYYITNKPEIKEEFLEDIYSYDAPFYIEEGDFGNFYWKIGSKRSGEINSYTFEYDCHAHGSVELKPENLFVNARNCIMVAYRDRIKYPNLKNYPIQILGNNAAISKWSSIKVKRLSSFKKLTDGWRYPLEDPEISINYIKKLDKKLLQHTQELAEFEDLCKELGV